MAATKSRPYCDEDWLRKKYVGEGMTLHEVADIAGVSHNCIRDWMVEFGIDRRDPKKRGVDYANFYTSKPQPDGDGGYERWDTREGSVKVHRLLAVAIYGFDSLYGKVVHHRNGVGWDNRDVNIELMTREEHSRHHKGPEDTRYRGESWLREKVDEGLSQVEIGDVCGVSNRAIGYWMDKYDITPERVNQYE